MAGIYNPTPWPGNLNTLYAAIGVIVPPLVGIWVHKGLPILGYGRPIGGSDRDPENVTPFQKFLSIPPVSPHLKYLTPLADLGYRSSHVRTSRPVPHINQRWYLRRRPYDNPWAQRIRAVLTTHRWQQFYPNLHP
ncbi:hypothetical protein K469DRAFT_694715 [Zopfia rhizophila CBS 207.26]|uniref:Uncharacterized protein n=1 Tax=Zopfia rhizophila CBS 207.26 TaxID=1314779 RepID=A0A6A6ERF4_9PEZI|nr:hypothetical protein K469DRAFT_694715 [Zopfia rhizophila CBS 207.26]